MGQFIDADDPNSIVVYTDGSCYPNPEGQGGWAFYVTHRGAQAVRYGFRKSATNNMMELTAIIRALEYVPVSPKHSSPLLIFTDSKYALNALTEWVEGWRLNKWRTSNGSPVKNKALVKRGYELIRAHEAHRPFQMRWVRGHTGIPENELVDRSANNARVQQKTNWRASKDAKTKPA